MLSFKRRPQALDVPELPCEYEKDGQGYRLQEQDREPREAEAVFNLAEPYFSLGYVSV